MAEAKLCQIHDHLKLTAPSGHIANVVTEETRCGGDDAPWLIEAKPGQRINLTLYDFTHYYGSDEARYVTLMISPMSYLNQVLYSMYNSNSNLSSNSSCNSNSNYLFKFKIKIKIKIKFKFRFKIKFKFKF